MSIRLVIDLELESDGKTTGKIIQLGYCIIDTRKCLILYTGGDYVNPGRPLHPFIISLTGITQNDIQTRGVSLHSAYNNMVSKYHEYVEKNYLENSNKESTVDLRMGGAFSQLIEWGSGDVSTLKQQLMDDMYEPLKETVLEAHQEIVEFVPRPFGKITKMVKNNYEWIFGNSSLNLKALFQMFQDSKGKNKSGGLKTSMKRMGLGFMLYLDEVSPGKFRQRSAHDSRADALNTARLFLLFSEIMRGVVC